MLELSKTAGRPATLGADAVHHRQMMRKELRPGLVIGVGHMAWRVHANWLQWLVESLQPLAIELAPRCEALRAASDDGQHERQAIVRRTNHGLGAATDRNPRLDRPRFRRRVYLL